MCFLCSRPGRIKVKNTLQLSRPRLFVHHFTLSHALSRPSPPPPPPQYLLLLRLAFYHRPPSSPSTARPRPRHPPHDHPSIECRPRLDWLQGKEVSLRWLQEGPYHAGQVIPVRFWNFEIKDYKKFPPPRCLTQSRHGGGACEFSLSYDGGKSWKVIGQYTKTCPDIYYEWPVLIPHDVPSCSDSDKCLFAMSWTAYATDQFFHHCANIIIKGSKNGHLPQLDMTIVDVTKRHQKMNVHAKGDDLSGKSSGPNHRERTMNTNGYHAYGGGAGHRGISLGLVRA